MSRWATKLARQAGMIPVKKGPRPRHIKGKMNGTEERYAADVLTPGKLAGEVLDWRFEAIKLRLADNTFYEPDFIVVTPELFEIHEVKGHWEDDARVKIKVAARLYPWLRFVAVKYDSKAKRFLFEEIPQ